MYLMDKETIIQRIIDAINIFIEKENFLLKHKLNERTITHKLAIYIEYEFPEYNVDCEYNRIWDYNVDEKTPSKELYLPIKNISSNDTKATIVYPDIIIHKRWINKNLLIIEVKKRKYAGDKYNDNMTNREFDEKKIEEYMKQLNYEYWLYLEFNNTNYFWIFYYKDNNEILSHNL